MAYSQAQKKATMKYLKENYDAITLRFPKGMKDKYKAHADLMGEPLIRFIERAISETIARDRARIRETMKNAPKPAEPEEE